MARPSGRDIRQVVLDEATDAIRSRGVTGFSYADLADRIGVRAPSIHHHFRRKSQLVAAALERHQAKFREQVDAIDAPSPVDRLRHYSAIFLSGAADGVLCVCGAAVVGWDDLDADARRHVSSFFVGEIGWVEALLGDAVAAGELLPDVDVHELAVAVVAALEGALLLARTGIDHRTVVDTLISVATVDPSSGA